jgi:predicted P-loop ATPase
MRSTTSEYGMTNVVVPLQHDDHWTDGLTLNKHGVPLGNVRNLLYAFRNAPEWKTIIAYDEFSAKVITTRSPPWCNRTVERWTDDDDTRACEWFQEQGIPATVGIVGRAVQTIARENPVHPIRDYLNALKWDGTPRLDTWLTRYLGVEDSPYVRAIGSRFLISGIARVFRPGCQADYMLILEGVQGILKSSALKALAGPWFADSISKLGSKDSAIEIAGVWLVEMSELDAMLRAALSATKSFVTRRHDRFRPPYAKHVIDRPRQCVFAGTINPIGGYLKDPTGGRRFWPVRCGVIDLEALIHDRDRLWAEALIRFRGGALWWLETSELQALAAAEQEARFEVDAWTEKVSQWLVSRTDVSIGEILLGALGIPQESWSQTAQNRIAKILVHQGFEQYRPGKKGQPRTPRYRRHAADHRG